MSSQPKLPEATGFEAPGVCLSTLILLVRSRLRRTCLESHTWRQGAGLGCQRLFESQDHCVKPLRIGQSFCKVHARPEEWLEPHGLVGPPWKLTPDLAYVRACAPRVSWVLFRPLPETVIFLVRLCRGHFLLQLGSIFSHVQYMWVYVFNLCAPVNSCFDVDRTA